MFMRPRDFPESSIRASRALDLLHAYLSYHYCLLSPSSASTSLIRTTTGCRNCGRQAAVTERWISESHHKVKNPHVPFPDP